MSELRPLLTFAALSAALVVAGVAGSAPRAPQNGRIIVAVEEAEQSRTFVLELQSLHLRRVKTADGAGSPIVSPDGRFVVFVPQNHEYDQYPTLWLARLDGKGRKRRLGSGGSPTWSPDGRRVAVVNCTGNEGPCDSAIVILDLNRPGFRRRAYSGRAGSLRWSPHGNWIAFARYEDDFVVNLLAVHPNGTGLHVIAHGVEGGYDWSPDGRRLVISARTSDGSDLYTVPVEGGAPTLITDSPIEKFDPRWSPDGKRIAYWTYSPIDPVNHVVIVDAAGGNERVIAEGIVPSWSPTGRALTFRAGTGISVARANGSGHELVLRSALGAYDQALSWLPNGGGLVFTRTALDNRSHLVSVLPNGHSVRRLSTDSVSLVDPASSSDGRALAVTRVYDLGNRQIAVMHRDGTGLRTLTRNEHGWDTEPTWSPNGKQIAFVRRTNSWAIGTLYTVRVADKHVRPLGVGKQPFHPAWSPDGRSIAVDGIRTSQRSRGIRLVDLASGSVSLVTHPPYCYDMQPSWSPDGKRILFLRYCSGGSIPYSAIYVATLGADDEHLLVAGSYAVARWSPDGKKVAVAGFLGADWAGGSPLVATLRPDGSDPLVVLEGAPLQVYPSSVTWAPK